MNEWKEWMEDSGEFTQVGIGATSWRKWKEKSVQLGQEPGLTVPLEYMTNTQSALDTRGW